MADGYLNPKESCAVEIYRRPRPWIGYAIGALLSLVAFSLLAGFLARRFGLA